MSCERARIIFERTSPRRTRRLGLGLGLGLGLASSSVRLREELDIIAANQVGVRVAEGGEVVEDDRNDKIEHP